MGKYYIAHVLTNYYRPQTKLRKGNVFTSVCQLSCSLERGGLRGRGDVRVGSVCVAGGGHGWDGMRGGGGGGGRGACVAGDTATAADGTHPSGMLSC